MLQQLSLSKRFRSKRNLSDMSCVSALMSTHTKKYSSPFSDSSLYSCTTNASTQSYSGLSLTSSFIPSDYRSRIADRRSHQSHSSTISSILFSVIRWQGFISYHMEREKVIFECVCIVMGRGKKVIGVEEPSEDCTE